MRKNYKAIYSLFSTCRATPYWGRYEEEGGGEAITGTKVRTLHPPLPSSFQIQVTYVGIISSDYNVNLSESYKMWCDIKLNKSNYF